MKPEPKPAEGFFLFADDFLGGVALLDLSQRGAYISLLAHQAKLGRLPHDLATLSRLVQADSVDQFLAIWNGGAMPLSQKFQEDERGLFNPRLEAEIQERIKRREANVRNGKAGAAKRWGRKAQRPRHGEPNGETNGEPIANPMANGMANTMPSPRPTPLLDNSAPGPPAPALGQQELAEPHQEPDRDAKPTAYSAEFLAWWAVYPRKAKKARAAAAFKAARRKVAQDDLMAATARFAAAWDGADLVHCPHPTTWLNAEQWTDDPEDWRRMAGGRNAKQSGTLFDPDENPENWSMD